MLNRYSRLPAAFFAIAVGFIAPPAHANSSDTDNYDFLVPAAGEDFDAQIVASAQGFARVIFEAAKKEVAQQDNADNDLNLIKGYIGLIHSINPGAPIQISQNELASLIRENGIQQAQKEIAAAKAKSNLHQDNGPELLAAEKHIRDAGGLSKVGVTESQWMKEGGPWLDPHGNRQVSPHELKC